MATLRPPNLSKMYDLLDPHLPSLRQGGIVGDTRHIAGGGYHISRDDLRSHGQRGDYSIQAPADQDGKGNYAAAIDLTLNTAEMKLVTGRLKAAFDRDDDRIDCLREFIGTLDGRNVCGWNRYRTGRRTGFYATGYSESSHLWHVHLSFFRRYCNDLDAIKGVVDVIAGKTTSASKPTPTTPKPTTPTEDEVTPADRKAIADDVVARLKTELPAAVWKWDGIEAPVGVSAEDRKKNPHWGPASFLRRIDAALTRIGAAK